MNALLLIVPLAPLVAALSALLVGRRAPRAAGRLAVGGTAIALLTLLALLGRRPRISTTWLQSADYTLTVGLRLDPLGLLLALPISRVLSDQVGMLFLGAPLSYTYSTTGALIWLVLSVSLAGLASFLPAWNASRLTVRDVLAYE